MLEAFVRGLPHVAGFLASLGGATAPVDLAAFDLMLPSWPYFPARATCVTASSPPRTASAQGSGLWRVLEAAVRDRDVSVTPDCPVRELVLEGGRVAGAIVESEGDPVRIGVRRGAVLASGSFEADAELRDTYLPPPLVSVGHPGNTGDTIRLAQGAGASLWHMSAFFGWLSFVHPGYPAAFTLDLHAPSLIYVDGDGRRFTDETGWEVHDRVRALDGAAPIRDPDVARRGDGLGRPSS